jgi:hypothetical protein
MCQIHLTLAWPTLNMLPTLTLTYSWAKPSNASLFYNKLFNIHANLLTTVLKVNTRMVVRVSLHTTESQKIVSLP